MTVTNQHLPPFALSAPADVSACQSLDYDGTRALRLAANGELAGILVGTSYFYVAMSLWLDSTTSGGVYLLECGRTTGYTIGYHTDPINNGNDAICVAINDGNSSNAYVARFEVDLLSGVGDKTLHNVEVQYIEATGFTCFVDGVEISGVSSGTDNGVGTASLTTQCTLGGTLNLNTLRTRGALNESGTIGVQSKWPSGDTGTVPAGMINGGITHIRIDVEPGVPAMSMDMEGDVIDTVDTGNTGVNHVTNGTSWLATGGSLAYTRLINWLLSDTSYNPLPIGNISVASVEGDTAPTTTIRLWNPSSAAFACSGFTVVEAGKSSVLKYIEADLTEVTPANLSTLTIPVGALGYLDAVIEHDNSVVGSKMTGSVTYTGSDQDQAGRFSLTVTEAIMSGGSILHAMMARFFMDK